MKLNDRLDFLDGDYTIIDEPVEGSIARTEVTNMEIWCECFREPAKRIQSRDSYAIGAILKRLGWERGGKRKLVPIYGLQRVYFKV